MTSVPPDTVAPSWQSADQRLAQGASRGPVVVFDSGIGGLSVLRSLMQVLPDEPFVYVADNAFVPYGDKPQSFIVDRTLAIAAHAHDVLGARALVIACNTATAAAVAEVRAQWPGWIVVGIEPAVKPAALKTRSGVIGILATSNTLASEKFRGLVEGFAADCRVLTQPCPGLVECIESGDLDGPDVTALLSGYVRQLTLQGADVIVLGCTHYPFVASLVQSLAGAGVQVLETGDAVARETRRRLEEASGGGVGDGAGDASGLVPAPVDGRQDRAAPDVRWLASGDPGALVRAARHLLGLQATVEALAV